MVVPSGRASRAARGVLCGLTLALWSTAAPVGAHPLRQARPDARPGAMASSDTAGLDAARGPAPPSGVRDPFFELLIAIAEHDSLGVWDHAALARYVAASGRRCQLPLDVIARIARRPATAAEAEQRRGAVVSRIWEIELTGPVRVSLPYGFLGYHPGSLAASSRFVFSEWRLGDQNLHAATQGRVASYAVTDVIVFRIDEGWFVLDVDAWLDRLLGGLLDDCWTDGFVIARDHGRPVEASLLVNRDGAPDFGQFELGQDRIVAHPEPIARGLSFLARPWTAARAGSPRRAWSDGAAEAATP